MQSHDEDVAVIDSAETRAAFQRRIMQIVFSNRKQGSIDPIAANRFQVLGFFESAKPPTLPHDLATVLRSSAHPKRLNMTDGPLIFVQEDSQATVMEAAVLLLQPEREIRLAVLDYLRTGVQSSEPWLTTRTSQLLAQLSGESEAVDPSHWRPAGIAVADAIRKDILAHFAGLRQSMCAQYQEGINEYIRKVMRPRLDELECVILPLVSPREQRSELDRWINEFASLPTIEEALAKYVDRCGYVPLSTTFGAAEVVRQWGELHPEQPVQWGHLKSWADSSKHPAAQYHAITVALGLPAVFSEISAEDLWPRVLSILEPGAFDDIEQVRHYGWELYCAAGKHFIHHIEASHPGAYGDRVACYGWWMATKLCELLGTNENTAKFALEKVVLPETELSYRRWMIARSPVAPSQLRHTSLDVRSVWAMSLIAELGRTNVPISKEQTPPDVWERIGTIIRGYLIATSLGQRHDEAGTVFAFQDRVLSGLGSWENWIPEDERNGFLQVFELCNRLANAQELQSQLEQLSVLPEEEQRLTLVFTSEAVRSTLKYDDVIVAWLTQTEGVVNSVQQVSGLSLVQLLDLMMEFHQRQRPEWSAQLPHILAYVLERTNDSERARLIIDHILVMSINAGIASPIQRISVSKWRAEVAKLLPHWRDSLIDIGQVSEPWVRARIRAMSATVSRLVGPRQNRTTSNNPSAADAPQCQG